jgi:hypothetical protein
MTRKADSAVTQVVRMHPGARKAVAFRIHVAYPGPVLLEKPFLYAHIKKQAASSEATCSIELPRLDEFRTYCYENVIEEIPAILVF